MRRVLPLSAINPWPVECYNQAIPVRRHVVLQVHARREYLRYHGRERAQTVLLRKDRAQLDNEHVHRVSQQPPGILPLVHQAGPYVIESHCRYREAATGEAVADKAHQAGRAEAARSGLQLPVRFHIPQIPQPCDVLHAHLRGAPQAGAAQPQICGCRHREPNHLRAARQGQQGPHHTNELHLGAEPTTIS